MSSRISPDELRALLPYANAHQTKYLEAYIELGSQRAAAEKFGVHQSQISQVIARVTSYAARKGFSPQHDMTKPAPPGFSVRGVSTLYGPEGDVKAQWVKTRIEDEHWREIAMTRFDMHREHGEVGRGRYSVGMVR